MFDGNFDKVLKEADRIWHIHKKNKGDSWKEFSFDVIANSVKEEYHEFRTAYREGLKSILDNDIEKEAEYEQIQFEELLDLINVCLIAAEKLRRRGG